ncbi:MAG: ABC transporter ATP-binding protein [Proteobacteria bacterium]|nr:ABC transporter ATP-binding protein [Pseudomonadota bacterium]MBU1695554.1 ABC transporter ATP-binding protein [Pseudomonadota bacterium]
MIKVNNIDVFYGNIQAIKEVSLSVNSGEIVALIGNNGAGKSTLLNSIVGLLRKQAGEISFQGRQITKMPTAEIIRLGISLVPEGRRLLGPMSVLDNLRLGAYLRFGKEKGVAIRKDFETVFQLFPRLEERSNQSAGTLSGGEQQMLAIARALMARPKAILMDEPSLGLAPIVVREIFGIIQKLKENGNTIFLAEQNARMALKFSDRAYVLDLGRIILQGDSKDLRENNEVKELYLGA